ncbi:MAG: DUF2384 domain-containing protein, partial [Chloroflexi bacterium]|nr:DUF2384 domain-containing protein [Chloroflexota bacterium]
MSTPKLRKPSAKSRRGDQIAAMTIKPVARKGRAPTAEFERLLKAGTEEQRQMTVQGVDASTLSGLFAKLQVPAPRFASFIGVSRPTLDRKLRSDETLGLPESDRVVRYARLWKQAVHLWGSDEAARQWLTSPSHALNGDSPLEHAITEIGARQVEDLMG